MYKAWSSGQAAKRAEAAAEEANKQLRRQADAQEILASHKTTAKLSRQVGPTPYQETCDEQYLPIKLGEYCNSGEVMLHLSEEIWFEPPLPGNAVGRLMCRPRADNSRQANACEVNSRIKKGEIAHIEVVVGPMDDVQLPPQMQAGIKTNPPLTDSPDGLLWVDMHAKTDA
jgi:hypothetical protein